MTINVYLVTLISELSCVYEGMTLVDARVTAEQCVESVLPILDRDYLPSNANIPRLTGYVTRGDLIRGIGILAMNCPPHLTFMFCRQTRSTRK